jgi:hypothetical protein
MELASKRSNSRLSSEGATLNEEPRSLITLLPYDIVITLSAFIALLLTLTLFVQRVLTKLEEY